MASFNTTTNNFVFSTSTPNTFDCFLRSGGANVSIYVNNTSTPSTLPSNTNFNFINLSDVTYLRLSSSQNFNLICAYKPRQESQSQITIEATTTLPSDFVNSVYLITGILIFGLIIFIGYLIFRYLRY
jgi:hypothetical protein